MRAIKRSVLACMAGDRLQSGAGGWVRTPASGRFGRLTSLQYRRRVAGRQADFALASEPAKADLPAMSNPYQSPPFDPSQFRDQPTYAPSQAQNYSWVSQVRIFAILNAV